MIKYELINYCEFDKYATKAYSLIHNEPEDKNLGDITKVNEKEIADFNWMTWGFPCQDISVAGEQKGVIKGETRSGLYYDGLRILKEKKPSISIIENVKNLTSKKFKETFEQILSDLDEVGYNNYWQVLNAKDYGVPQNRERVFIISIRKELDNGKFEFPKGFDNGIRLKDMLEDEVDEKYYISQDKVDKLIKQLKDKEISNTVRAGGRGSLDRHQWDMVCVNDAVQINRGEVKVKEDDICSCIDANYYKGLDNHAARTGIMQVGMLDIKGNEQVRRVYDPDGLSPTLNSMQGGNRQPKILEENDLKFVGGIDTTDKWIENEKVLSRNYKEGYRVYDSDGVACCQKSNGGGIGSYTGLYKVDGCSTRTRNYINQPEQLEIRKDELSNSITTVQKDSMVLMEHRIRKLTPLECFRLMGFKDEDFYILKENKISNTQCYKMAGNSIVVDVLYYIYLELYRVMPYLFEDIKLGSFFSGIGAFEKALERLQNDINKGNLKLL